MKNLWLGMTAIASFVLLVSLLWWALAQAASENAACQAQGGQLVRGVFGFVCVEGVG